MNFSLPYGTSNGSNSPMVVFFIQIAFQRPSHAQIRVQMNKLCHQQIGEEKSLLAVFVATKPVTKLCCDKTRFCRNRFSNKLCHNKPIFFRNKPRFCRDTVSNKTLLRKKYAFVATKLATNFVVIKPDFVATKPVTKLS